MKLNKKMVLLIILFFLLLGGMYCIYYFIMFFKAWGYPSEKKFERHIIKVGNSFIWEMKNQQDYYDNKKYEPKIYFYMSNKQIEKDLLLSTFANKKNTIADDIFFIFFYFESKNLPKYWLPDDNNFSLDLIEFHDKELYLIIKYETGKFSIIDKSECAFYHPYSAL